MKASIGTILLAVVSTSVAADAGGLQSSAGSPQWTGPYLGATLGVRRSEPTWQTTSVNVIASTPTDTPSNPSHFDSNATDARLLLGYAWQVAPQWLAGIEADLGLAKNRKTKDGIPGTGDPVFGPPVLFRDHTRSESGRDQSLRLRLGYLLTPQWQLYGTAGVTRQKFTASVECTDDSNPLAAGPWCAFTGFGPSPVISDSISFTRTGRTFGGGAEFAVGPRWSLRAEYRWSDFGRVSHSFLADSTNINVVNAQLKLRQQALAAGLVYRF